MKSTTAIEREVHLLIESLLAELIANVPFTESELEAIKRITFEEMNEIKSLRDLFAKTSLSIEDIEDPLVDVEQLFNYDCYIVLWILGGKRFGLEPAATWITTDDYGDLNGIFNIFDHPIRIVSLTSIIQQTLAGRFRLFSDHSYETWSSNPNWLHNLSTNNVIPPEWIEYTHTCYKCGIKDHIDPIQLTRGVMIKENYVVDGYYFKCANCGREIWSIQNEEYKKGEKIEENVFCSLRSLHNIARLPIQTPNNTNSEIEAILNGEPFTIDQIGENHIRISLDGSKEFERDGECCYVRDRLGNYWLLEGQQYYPGSKDWARITGMFRSLKNVGRLRLITPHNTQDEIQAFLEGESYTAIPFAADSSCPHIRLCPEKYIWNPRWGDGKSPLDSSLFPEGTELSKHCF